MLIVHDVHRIGHRHAVLHLRLSENQEASDFDLAPCGSLIRQQIVGIQGFPLLPNVPPFHHRIDGLLRRLHQTDRLGIGGGAFIGKGLCLQLLQFPADCLDLLREIPGTFRHMQHDIHGRQRQGPVFLRLLGGLVLLRDQQEFHRIPVEQLRDFDAELRFGNLETASHQVGIRLCNAKLFGQRIITGQRVAVFNRLEVPGNFRHRDSVEHESWEATTTLISASNP